MGFARAHQLRAHRSSNGSDVYVHVACLPEAVVEEAGLAAEALLLGEKVAP